MDDENATIDDSILGTVKKMLGIPQDYKQFDTDVIIHINSVFSILSQLGVGPEEGFSIKDDTSLWSDYIPDGKALSDVKTYVYLKVRLIFDPPSASSAVEAMNKLVSEFEWRINVAADTEKEVKEDG